MSDDLPGKVRKWLRGEGFPFELQVGRVLREMGWEVDHGLPYEDPATQKTRELDLRARWQLGDKRGVVTVTLAVACKSSRGHPWVTFTSAPSNLDIVDCLRVPGSLAGHAVLYALSGENGPLSVFPLVARVAHGATRAFTKKRSSSDASGPYATGRAALSAATALAHAHERFVEQHAPRTGLVEIPIPIVFLDGTLFEFFVNESGEEVLEETSSVLMSVPEPLIGDQVCYVLVVQRDALEDVGRQVLDGAQELAERCLPHAKRLVREHMEHVEGARMRRKEASS